MYAIRSYYDEVRLTPIEGVYLEHVQAGNMQFVTRIQGNQDLPILV